jgi:hypothetical protein
MQTFQSVVLYYVDETGKRRTRVVALQRLFGSHSGENQAAVLLQVFERLGINDPSILGFFMADNADSCDTSVRAVLRSLYPSRSSAERDALEHLYRCRCVGHILNLAAKAFLEGEDCLDDDLDDPTVDLEVVRRWRKQGPVGKLHNLVRWIRRGPKRKDRFMEFSTSQFDRAAIPDHAAGLIDADEAPPGLVLVSDNETRWNSTLAMILRALRLRRVLALFCAVSQAERKEEDRPPAEDVLTDEDWQVLTELVAILQPLWRLTKRFEGNAYLRFGEVLPHLHLLQKDMRELQDLYLANEDRQAAQIQDVIFVQVADPDGDDDLVSYNEPEPVPPVDTPAPDRPRRRTRQPTRLDDYYVEMPTQRRCPAPAAIANPHRPTEDVLMEDDASEELSDRGKAVIRQSIQLMRDKIAKYEALLDDNIVGWAAVVLDPRIKMRWVAKHLPSVRRDMIMTRLRDFYDHHYPARLQTPTTEDPTRQERPLDRSLPSFNALLDLGSDEEHDAVDELSDYLAQPLDRSLQEDLILDWWRARRDRWPRLFSMAMDLLSIPSMSSENERSFSQAKLVITSQRYRLHYATLNKLVCLKAWNRDGDFLENYSGTGLAGAAP